MGQIYLPKLIPDSTSVLNGVTVHKYFLKDHNVIHLILSAPSAVLSFRFCFFKLLAVATSLL